MASATVRQPGCLAILLMVAPLVPLGLLGLLWTGTSLPETTGQVFGTVLAGVVARLWSAKPALNGEP